MQLPVRSFFLFGMGNRRKLLYSNGKLLDARTGEVLHDWDVAVEHIVPEDYTVRLETRAGKFVVLQEDEVGVWRAEDGRRECLTAAPLHLPAFHGRHAGLLRTLHHEILINIVDGLPVPNFFVYRKPWYRDAAMMCMCLARTGNLHLVSDWILGLREPFDRNNAGHREPDNLGQALYMISLVSDASHPLVTTILQTIPEFQRERHIVGMSDFQEHPVYQTKWLKFGLRALGLDDPFEIPAVYDGYSALFWWDYRDSHVAGAGFGERASELYPYLTWAEAHFHGAPPPMPVCYDRYPLTWEALASQADYPGMAMLSARAVEERVCFPHTWHAAEMFLYFAAQ